MIPVLLIGLALVYAAIIGRFAVGFRRAVRRPVSPPEGEPPTVSVVVPARNEAAGIEACVRSILSCDYPADRLQVIVADDQSTDATPEIVEAMRERLREEGGGTATMAATLRLVRVAPGPSHKKRALQAGIARATGELVLTTDADCTVPPGWVRAMAACFGPETGFVSGPVLYRERPSLFAGMQALEFLGLVGIGAGAIGLGRPHLCNGASLGFRRAAFVEVGGYEDLDHVTTGDDELLMHRFAYDSPWEVRFCPDPGAAVRTDPNPTLAAFVEQRRRWASIGSRYTRLPFLVVCVLLFAALVALLAGFAAALVEPGLWPAFLAAFSVKAAADASMLVPATRHFGRRRLLRFFIPAELVHVPYLVLASVLGALGGYTWRGRRVRR